MTVTTIRFYKDAVGCGPWEPPLINNPEYKGKWRAPLIDNPNYKGKWKPRRIPNPDFYEDKKPFKMPDVVRTFNALTTIHILK